MNDLQDGAFSPSTRTGRWSLWTGLAQWARRGAEVTVVTCTPGEEGEVMGRSTPVWSLTATTSSVAS